MAKQEAVAGNPVETPEDATKKILALFNSMELPVLATGAPHTTYAQDLIPLGKVQARKVGSEKWLTLFSEDKKAEVAKIPQSQLRALLFTMLAFLQTPRTDRGYAYCQWVAANAPIVEKYLGDYEILVTTPKGTLPVIVATIKDLLAGVAVRAKILTDSVKMQAPVKSVGTKHATAQEEYDLVL